MEWIPVVLVIFKVVVLVTGMFFAVKWHYDQAKKEREMQRGAVLRASGTVALLFVVSLVGLVVLTFVLGGMLGLDLSFG